MKNVEIATNFLKKLKNWCDKNMIYYYYFFFLVKDDKNMIGATECLSKFLFDVARI